MNSSKEYGFVGVSAQAFSSKQRYQAARGESFRYTVEVGYLEIESLVGMVIHGH